MIRLSIREAAIERARKALDGIPGATVKALSATLNRAIDGARTDAARAATKIYFVKTSEILQSILVKRSKPGPFMTASLISTGNRRPLSEYRLKPNAPQKGKPMVQAAVKREGGMKEIPSAYIAPGGSGSAEAYISGKRLMSPAVPQLVNNPDVVAYIEEQGVGRFEKALDNQILRLLGEFK